MSNKYKDTDWSKSNTFLAREYSVSEQSIFTARKRYAPETMKSYKDPLTDYLQLTGSQRREMLSNLLSEAARNIEAAANVFTCMKSSGDDIDWVPRHVQMMLGKIAAKTMIPEVMFGLGGRLRSRVMQLPLKEQERVVSGEKFKVATAVTHKYIEPRNMTTSEIEQVFSDSGIIRSIDQQRAWIESQKEQLEKKSKQRKANTPTASFKIDESTGGLLVESPGLISIEELRELID